MLGATSVRLLVAFILAEDRPNEARSLRRSLSVVTDRTLRRLRNIIRTLGIKFQCGGKMGSFPEKPTVSSAFATSLQIALVASMLLTWLSGLAVADPTLEASLQARGGLARWHQYNRLDYDLTWRFGSGEPLRDHQLIALQSRRILITNDQYKIGYDAAMFGFPPTGRP